MPEHYIVTTANPTRRIGAQEIVQVEAATPEEATRVLRSAISRATGGLNTGATVRSGDGPRTIRLPGGVVVDVRPA